MLATIAGLQAMKTPEEVARLRGKSVEEILGLMIDSAAGLTRQTEVENG